MKNLKIKKIARIFAIFIVAFCISQAGGWTSVSADFDTTGFPNSSSPHFYYWYPGHDWGSVFGSVASYTTTSISTSSGGSPIYVDTVWHFTDSFTYYGGTLTSQNAMIIGELTDTLPDSHACYGICTTGVANNPLDISSYADGNYFFMDMYDSSYLFFTVTSGVISATSASPIADSTCIDGVMNQDETAIDYGGICNTLTILQNFSPAPDSTTTSNVFPVEFDYFISSATDSIYTKFAINVCPKSYPNSSCFNSVADIAGYDETLHFAGDATVNPDEKGLYEVVVQLWNGDESSSCSWWNVLCSPKTKLTQYGAVWSFNVVNLSGQFDTPPVIHFTNLGAPEVCGSALTDLPCNLGLALQNVFKWIFVPDMHDFGYLTTVYDDVKTKVPFNFIDVMVTAWSDVADNTTGNDDSVSIAIGSSSISIFSPELLSSNPIAPIVRGALVITFWLMLVFALYSRAINIFRSDGLGSRNI